MTDLTGKRVGARDRVSELRAALADTTAVHQITLTGPLAFTVPTDFPAGQVYRVTLTQDDTGGHTVTYDGKPVTVATAAGASTTVEFWPNGEVAYPVAAPLSSTLALLAHVLATSSIVRTDGLQARAENAPAPCVTPTYDGSGQAIHPSVVYFPAGWRGWRYWMAMTPYTGTSSAVENPSILVSQDGETWEVPAGLTNPIVPRPTPPGGVNGYNSDVELVWADGVLYCVYRSTVDNLGIDTIRVISSSDGVTWGGDTLLLTSPAGSGARVSPTVVHDPVSGVWSMWLVTNISGAATNNEIHLLTAPAITGPWTDKGVCAGLTARANHEPWHIHVHEDAGELTMFYTQAPNGTASPGLLWRAVSPAGDGLAWSRDAYPTLSGNNANAGGAVTKWDAATYRACSIPAIINGARGYRLWYSALGAGTSVWGTGACDVALEPPGERTTRLHQAAMLIPPWLACDLVTRPDDPSSPGALTTGQTWSVAIGGFGVTNGLIHCLSNTNSIATIDAGTPDIDVEIEAVASPTYWNLVFRAGAAPGTSWWQIGTNGTAKSGIRLRRYDGSTITEIGTRGFVFEDGLRLRVIAKGNRIRGYADGVLIWDVEDSFNSTATRVGFQLSSTTVKLKNFILRPAA